MTMKIIEIEPLSNGAHRNQQGEFKRVPEGWAVIPENMAVPITFPFVDITVEEIQEQIRTVEYTENEDGSEIPNIIISERIIPTVKTMTAGTVPEPEPEPEPEPQRTVYDEMAEAYTQGVNSI